jgi:hypothetical protein
MNRAWRIGWGWLFTFVIRHGEWDGMARHSKERALIILLDRDGKAQ